MVGFGVDTRDPELVQVDLFGVP